VKAKKLVANQQLESFFSTFSLRRRNALNVGADFNVGNDGRTTSEKNDIAGKMRS
jgi:FAD synthase